MAWPAFIDVLKERYLNNEGNFFLLHGAVEEPCFTLEGEPADAVQVLAAFLAATRGVVGVIDFDAGLSFPNFGDESRFDRLVAAQEVLSGSVAHGNRGDVLAALGQVWRSLATTGVDQGWLLRDIQRLLPAGRPRVEPLGAGAPVLFEWPGSRRLSQSNHIVIALTRDAASVRQELVANAVGIAVARPAPKVAPTPPMPSHESAPELASDAEVDAFLAAPAEPTTEDRLTAALHATLANHEPESWPSEIPVMDAVAVTMHVLEPELVGPLSFAVNEEGKAAAEGPGAEWFLQRWKADIAFSAAAGMLLKALVGAPGGAPIDPTATRALARRIDRVITGSRASDG
jgi:hypothetical protein